MIEIPPLPEHIAYDQWCIVEGHVQDYTNAWRGKSGELVSVPYFPYGLEDDGKTPKRIPCFVIGMNSPVTTMSELRPSDTAVVLILCPVPDDKEALMCMVQRGYTVSVFPEKTGTRSVDYVGSSRPDIFRSHAEFVCIVK